MQVETRRSLVVLTLTISVFVALGAVWVDAERKSKAQFGVRHIYQVPKEITTFPAYLANTIVDRNGVARIAMLQ